MTVFEKFLLDLSLLIENKSLIKLSLGNYKGAETSLKNIYIKPVEIKQELMLSFVYRHQTKDITKNYSIEDAIVEIKELVGFKGFRQVNVQLIEENLVFQMNKKAEWRVQQEKVAEREGQSYSHDHQKERKLTSSSKPYLHQLNLTDSEGKVYKNAQDK